VYARLQEYAYIYSTVRQSCQYLLSNPCVNAGSTGNDCSRNLAHISRLCLRHCSKRHKVGCAESAVRSLMDVSRQICVSGRASNAVSADKKASVSPSMMYSDMSDSDVSVEDPAIGPAFVEAAVAHVPGHSFQCQLGNGVVKYRGVYKAGNKWRAMITSRIEGVNQYVGLYDTQEEAAAAIAAITGTSVRKAEAKRKPAFDLERYSGVRKYHNVWRAEGYRYGQQRKHLGLFATKDEAQQAVAAYMNSAFGAIADETQLQVEVAASATVTGDA